jgi:hypothetical protein
MLKITLNLMKKKKIFHDKSLMNHNKLEMDLQAIVDEKNKVNL